jgi:hypothetical protein
MATQELTRTPILAPALAVAADEHSYGISRRDGPCLRQCISRKGKFQAALADFVAKPKQHCHDPYHLRQFDLTFRLANRYDDQCSKIARPKMSEQQLIGTGAP